MSKHSPQIIPVLAVATVVGLVCAGLTLAKPPKDADKPDKGLPPVADSSGVIYYWDQGDPYGDYGLVVKINAGGTGVDRLVNSGVTNSFSVTGWDVSYGSQSRFFIYEAEDSTGAHGLYVDGEHGGLERRIHGAPEFYASGPALSRNDQRVAFYGVGDGYYDSSLYVADLVYGDSSGLPTAVDNVVEVFHSDGGWMSPPAPITWSPDGSYIAFQPWFSRSGIIKVPLLIDEDGKVTGGGTPEIIATVSDPAWSPWLDLGCTTSRIAAFAPAAKKGYEISTFFPDGTGTVLAVTKVNSGVPTNRLPAWSPDGQQIAFRAQRSNGEALMRTAADGSTSAANLTGFSTELTVRRICWRP